MPLIYGRHLIQMMDPAGGKEEVIFCKFLATLKPPLFKIIPQYSSPEQIFFCRAQVTAGRFDKSHLPVFYQLEYPLSGIPFKKWTCKRHQSLVSSFYLLLGRIHLTNLISGRPFPLSARSAPPLTLTMDQEDPSRTVHGERRRGLVPSGKLICL